MKDANFLLSHSLDAAFVDITYFVMPSSSNITSRFSETATTDKLTFSLSSTAYLKEEALLSRDHKALPPQSPNISLVLTPYILMSLEQAPSQLLTGCIEIEVINWRTHSYSCMSLRSTR